MSNYVTLSGVALAELPALLDAELPAEAYTPVPGGAELTDIDPAYMRQTLNKLFGICGLGWGYDYTEAAIKDNFTGESGQRAHEGTVTRLEFWYTLVDEQGSQVRCAIPASGGSENRSASYALKGAITNAIGQAASNIGFQESVYLGHRSHKTVRLLAGKKSTALKPAPVPAKSAAAKAEQPLAAPKVASLAAIPTNGNGNGSKPAQAVESAPVAIAEIEDLDEPAPSQPDLGAYVIPIGKSAGKTLAEMSQEWLEWAATKMQPGTEQAKALQQAVKAYLAQKGSSFQA